MKDGISSKKVAIFIFKSVQPFRVALLVMFLIAITWAIDLSLRPYLLKIIIDRVTDLSNKNVFEYVSLPAISYFLMTFIHSTLYRCYDYFVEINMVPKLRRNIADTTFSWLLKESYSYYQNNFSGSLTNKINDLTNSVPDIIQIIIDSFLSHVLALIIAIYTLWQVNSKFAIIMFTWTAVFILGALFFSKRLTHLADIWSERSSTIIGKIVDALSNILSIRLFSREAVERANLKVSLDAAVEAEKKLYWTYFWVWFSYGYSFVFVQGLSLYILLKGRQEGWLTAGDFVVVMSINFAIVDFLWQLAHDFTQFSRLFGKTTQALRTIFVVPEIQDQVNSKQIIVKKGEIIFSDVCFRYGGVKSLFQNMNIKIEGGQKIGLVGYSGGGKSTFINLILRLYEVNSGHIFIDGQDIREVSQESLHNVIAMLPQDPSLFHRSLMDNIRYGRIDASDKEVFEAAKHAHAHEFIIKLPHGYSSLVGERGVKLSGGQRQRIGIARAILKNAPILILDEATSQLDSVTEKNIQESLWELMQNKTVIVIAHRLSTLLQMDRILVFHKGGIIEDGSHQGLINKNRFYKKLWNAQVGGFLIEEEND